MYNYNYEELVTFLKSKFKSVYEDNYEDKLVSRLICSHDYVSKDEIEYADNFQIYYDHLTNVIEAMHIFTAEFCYNMAPAKLNSYSLENLAKLIDRFIV